LLARLGWFAGARDHDRGDTECREVGSDVFVPVTAVGSEQYRSGSEACRDAFDGWADQTVVGRVPDVHAVVEGDPVGVVDDLCLVTKLDWFAEPAFADRAGGGFMQ
jgi:hypothetical protein